MGRGRQSALFAMGLVAGLLVAGLLVPLAVGDRKSAPGGSSLASGPSESSASELAGSDTGSAPSGSAGSSDPASQAAGRTGIRSGSGSATAAAGTGGATAGQATAVAKSLTTSDRGVTPTSIRVGFLVLDLGQTGRLGVNTTGVDPKQQEQALQAYADDINRRGGINGRKIDAVYRVFDVTRQDDMRAACLEMHDKKVFAVIAMPGYAGPATQCVTVEHQTPLLLPGQSAANEYFARAQGRYITLNQAGNRFMYNMVGEYDSASLLKGKKIGVLTNDIDSTKATVDAALIPALQRAGSPPAHVAVLSQDRAQAGSQIPVEVQRMRSAGVDTVILVVGFLDSTPFVQTAEGQGWSPQYLVSEFIGMTSDFETQAMGSSYNGAIAMTSQRFGEWRINTPEPAPDARCREVYEKASGQRLPRNNGNESNSAYATLLFGCALVNVFESGAKAAGPELTRARFVAGVQGLGKVEIPWYFPGSFGPGKTDANDFVRFIRWQSDCRCYKPIDAVRPARHLS